MSKKILTLSLSCLLLLGLFKGYTVNAGSLKTNALVPLLSSKYTFSDNFEEDKLSPSYFTERAPVAYAGAFSDKHAHSNSLSYRFELRKSDPSVTGSKRTEIALPAEKALQEHWYTASIYLPKGGAEDFANDFKSDESFFQWHNVPDAGGSWTMPPLALIIHNGNWAVNRNWDPETLSTDERIIANNYHEENNLGSYKQDKGKWVTWTFHVKWGWLASQSPILEVYKNGIKVLDRTGLPNTMNSQSGVYTKLGIYKWDWMADETASASDPSVISKRVVYFDDFKIR